jgi:C-terminal processing protease CtpA/Prc
MIRKGDNFYNPYEYDMSGLNIRKIPTDEKRFYVAGVRDDSPAQFVGIQPNDEVLSINKIPVIIWELSDIAKLFRSEEGKVIELEVRRYFDNDISKYEDFRYRLLLEKQI